MPNPIVNVTVPTFKGIFGEFSGTVDFQGNVGQVAYYLDPYPTGTPVGPLSLPVTSGAFSKTGLRLGDGRWKVRIVATPTANGSATTVSTGVLTMNRASLRAVLPLQGGVGTSSPDSPAVWADPETRQELTTAMLAAAVGVKRAAGAAALSSSMGGKQLLKIYSNGTLVLRAEYVGVMTVTNDVNGVILHPGTLTAHSILEGADLTVGHWRFSLQGGINFSRALDGSVGPIGSGKQLILSENPVAGGGFSSLFAIVMPTTIDP